MNALQSRSRRWYRALAARRKLIAAVGRMPSIFEGLLNEPLFPGLIYKRGPE